MYRCSEHGDVGLKTRLFLDPYGYPHGYSVCPICEKPTLLVSRILVSRIVPERKSMIESQFVQSFSKIDGDAANVVWHNAKLAMDIGPFKKDDVVDTLVYGYDLGEISVSHQGINYVFEAIIQAGKQIR